MRLILLLLMSFSVHAQVKFPTDFVFGVSNAPAQVEDNLDDIWLDWGLKENIRTWKITPNSADRLKFWTRPEAEIGLAKNLGVQSFRMGIDWGRVMTSPDTFDEKAIRRYKEIVQSVKSKGMKVMMTLSHHSVPKWIQEKDGWHNDDTKKHFMSFAQKIIGEFHQDVDWWITFNEANVFVAMAYTTGMWPPGENKSPLSLLAFGPFKGSSIEAMDRMADVHNEIYTWAHKSFPQIKIGLAHNLSNYSGKGFIDQIKSYFVDRIMNWRFPERVRDHMDFFGFNYYGAEWLRGTQIDIDPEEEYSESGRAIDVIGLYDMLTEIDHRFKGLPIIITENGVADSTDNIRPAYLIEHLMAVHKAISDKIPVTGYYVWTLTDNLEWTDGYRPKFGLVDINRKTFKRTPRSSFYAYKKIAETKAISKRDREIAWNKVLAQKGKERPFCRDEDGQTGFDIPLMRKYSEKDWRFILQD